MIQSNLLQKFNKIRHYYFDKKDSLEKFQIKSSSLVTLEQVHGNKIILINTQKNNYYKSYDGAVTSQSLFLGISTADCLPIFLYDPVKTIIAAVHAGWKGLYLDILKRAMAKINRLGGCPGNLYVGIGPHIRVCCYHVPLSRVLLFEKKQKAHPFSFSVIFNSLWYLDLEKIVLMEMLKLGIPRKQIDISQVCTSCDLRFHSFRRDGPSSKRSLNIIGQITTSKIE